MAMDTQTALVALEGLSVLMLGGFSVALVRDLARRAALYTQGMSKRSM